VSESLPIATSRVVLATAVEMGATFHMAATATVAPVTMVTEEGEMVEVETS
jgi:hypothetical protein